MNDDERKEVFGEVLADELKVIREYVEDIPTIKKVVYVLQSHVSELKSDMKVVTKIVKKHNKQLNNHKKRITKLELAHS